MSGSVRTFKPLASDKEVIDLSMVRIPLVAVAGTDVLKIRSLRYRAFHGSSVVILGSLGWQAMRLLSSMILARLLGPEQFGLASMFLLILTFVELTANVGQDKQLVQASDGGSPRFIANCHAFSSLRGLLLAIVILCIANPVASLLGIPKYSWAFALLAICPICNGLSHLGRKMVQRDLRFAPDMFVDLISQSAALVVAVGLAWLTRHFTAALWAILAGAVVSMIASYFVTELPYRWAWDSAVVRRMIRFGWPLFLSNIILFAVMHGERLLLASAPRLFPDGPYTTTDLGLFAAAGTLAYAPMVVIARLGATVSLPLLSSVKGNKYLFERRTRQISIFLLLCGLAVSVLFLVAGPFLLNLIYGAAYIGAAPTLMFLGVSQAIRIVRIAPTTCALALGNSSNTLWANFARAFGLGISLWVLSTGLPLVWLAGAAAGAELLALLVAIWCYRLLSISVTRASTPEESTCVKVNSEEV